MKLDEKSQQPRDTQQGKKGDNASQASPVKIHEAVLPQGAQVLVMITRLKWRRQNDLYGKTDIERKVNKQPVKFTFHFKCCICFFFS